MNFEELKAKIQEIGVDKFANEDFDTTLLPAFTEVHSEGNREGGGDHSEIVRHFTEDNIYVQVTGYYSSYEGTDWDHDSVKQVLPKEKTITVYE